MLMECQLLTLGIIIVGHFAIVNFYKSTLSHRAQNSEGRKILEEKKVNK